MLRKLARALLWSQIDCALMMGCVIWGQRLAFSEPVSSCAPNRELHELCGVMYAEWLHYHPVPSSLYEVRIRPPHYTDGNAEAQR